MLKSKSVIERAFELADTGRFCMLQELRRALIAEGYTQSDVFVLEGRTTAAQLYARCAEGFSRPSRPMATASSSSPDLRS